MTRKFLFEIVNEIRQFENPEKDLKEIISKDKKFADFFDLTYNKAYDWNFDSKFKVKARNNRVNGGDVSGWVEICRLIRKNLINSTKESPNFPKRLERILETCNLNDIKIILCMLKNRSIQYINTKKIYQWFPELKNETE